MAASGSVMASLDSQLAGLALTSEERKPGKLSPRLAIKPAGPAVAACILYSRRVVPAFLTSSLFAASGLMSETSDVNVSGH